MKDIYTETDSLSLEKKHFIDEKWIVFGMLSIYFLTNIIYGLLATGTWDDDCPTRYYNTLNAINDPVHFISLWNRPLFTFMFFLPVQISKHSILIIMTLISTMSAYVLYNAVKEFKIKYAYLVIPFFLFQAFFFGLSRNAMTEPLAAALICLGFLFYVRKQYLAFAIVGSLVPLARLELSVLLGIWGIILILQKQWKYIPILAVPVIIWSLAGTYFDGDWLWLYHEATGEEDKVNRYGHQTFSHYFHRYIYVLGPVVFYFFILGLWKQIIEKKAELFITGQFILGFLLYVIFAWKLSMGDSAGFLRNLTPLGPLAAVIALYGFNLWMEALRTGRKEIAKEQPEEQVHNRKAKKQKSANMSASEKRAFFIENQRKKKEDELKGKEAQRTYQKRYAVIFISILIIIAAFFFFSKKLQNHHNISDIPDYLNLIIISGLTITFIFLSFYFRSKPLNKGVKAGIFSVLFILTAGFTLVTEPPDNHMSPERITMEQVSDLYLKGYLKDHQTYVNHVWFFWANDLDRHNSKFKTITEENLKEAPEGSIVVWESHYSHRLAGDVKIDFFAKNPKFVELFRYVSTDNKFYTVVFQKEGNNSSAPLETHNRFISFAPELASAYASRGNTKSNKLRDYKEAIEDYSKAIELDSTYIDAYFNRGLAKFNIKEYQKSAEDYVKVIQLKPDYTNAYFNLGAAKANLEANAEALANFTKVIELDPKYVNAYMNRAFVYNKMKDYSKAIADYEKIIELEPNNTMAYFNAGVLYLQTGQKDKGCNNLVKAKGLGYNQANGIIQQYCLQ